MVASLRGTCGSCDLQHIFNRTGLMFTNDLKISKGCLGWRMTWKMMIHDFRVWLASSHRAIGGNWLFKSLSPRLRKKNSSFLLKGGKMFGSFWCLRLGISHPWWPLSFKPPGFRPGVEVHQITEWSAFEYGPKGIWRDWKTMRIPKMGKVSQFSGLLC